MAIPLPAWEMKSYSALWKKFKNIEFTNKEALEVLKIDSHKLSILFYNLRKKGWIDIKRDKEDQRKKIYKLKEPAEIVENLR